MAGLTGFMTLRVSRAGAKGRQMTVDGAGSQHNRSWLTGIFIGADIAGLMVISMAGMAIQAGNRMLGISLGDDIGHRGVSHPNVRDPTGVVTESAIALMLDKDIVPGGQVPIAVVMTNSARLTRIGVRTKTDSMIFVAAACAVIVAGKIAQMAHDALAIGCRGASGRAFQPTIGAQVVTGGATAHSMSFSSSGERRNRGAMATATIRSHRCRGHIGLHRRGMIMGMATKIGGMAVGAGSGGFSVTESRPGRITPNAGDVQKIA